MLLTGGKIPLFYYHPCVGVTSYPCTGADTLELVARALRREGRGTDLPGLDRVDGFDVGDHGMTWLQPETIAVQVQDPVGRHDGKWRTGTTEYHESLVDQIAGTEITFNFIPSSWSAYTFVISDVMPKQRPSAFSIIGGPSADNTILDADTKSSLGPLNLPSATTSKPFPAILEFSTLGTYKISLTVGATKSGTIYTDTGTYTFHVGPVADLELQGAWDAPGVFTLTARNHGPDYAPAARVTVTPPPGVRIVGGKASQGSYANGVWDIGTLETPQHRRAEGLPEGATLTIYTAPFTEAAAAGKMVTGSIENTEDYCVRIKTGDPIKSNDLECRGSLPSGYTRHSAAYLDHRPDNNQVALGLATAATAETMPPVLKDLAIVSTPARSKKYPDTYLPGQDIRVEATFTKPVRVTGDPALRLDAGGVTRQAALVNRSGSAIRLAYRVQPGDSDPVNGISIPRNPFLLPEGAAIRDANGNAPLLAFAGLGHQAGHKVASPGAAVDPAAPPPTPTPRPGRPPPLAATIDYLHAAPGNGRVNLRWSGSSSHGDNRTIMWQLWRMHDPVWKPITPIVDSLSGALSLAEMDLTNGEPGGTLVARVRASDPNGDVLTYAYTGASDGLEDYFTVDPDPNDNGIGEVRVKQRIPWDIGPKPGGVTWQWKRSPEGTTAGNVDTTDFNDIPGATGAAYTPVAEDEGRWLRALAVYADPFGEGKRARAQTANPVAAAAADEPPSIIEGPTFNSPASGDTYGEGEQIEVSLTFSEPVTVTGNPRLGVVIGEDRCWARYSEPASGGAALVFAYTVQAADADGDGIRIRRNALRLNGGNSSPTTAPATLRGARPAAWPGTPPAGCPDFPACIVKLYTPWVAAAWQMRPLRGDVKCRPWR